MMVMPEVFEEHMTERRRRRRWDGGTDECKKERGRVYSVRECLVAAMVKD